MNSRDAFLWSSRTKLGIVLFVLSLAGLAVIEPSEISISCAIGGGASLGLFGTTGSRLPLVVLTTLATMVGICAAFVLIKNRDLALVPVALAQLLALRLLEARKETWVDDTADSAAANLTRALPGTRP